MGSKSCGHELFVCGNCGAKGCRIEGCSKQKFEPIDKCKDCGRAYEMSPAATSSKKSKPAAPVSATAKPPRPSSRQWPTELVFGAGIAAVALAAVSYSFLSSHFHFGPPHQGHFASSISRNADLCACYNAGFSRAGSGVGVMSPEYRTGFLQCRATLDAEGGKAWTAGWNARYSARAFEASCRSYLRQK